MYYIAGGQEMRKDRKTRKSREEKMVGFSSASLFPARKREAVSQGGPGIGDPTWRKTQGAGTVKGYEYKRDRGCIPDRIK